MNDDKRYLNKNEHEYLRETDMKPSKNKEGTDGVLDSYQSIRGAKPIDQIILEEEQKFREINCECYGGNYE